MLTIIVPGIEVFDEASSTFSKPDETTLQLEHSLVSLSKWESKWETPFIGDKPKSNEQTMNYVHLMTLTKNVDPEVYNRLSSENAKEISDYIDSKMTATWFTDPPVTPGHKEVITAEIIYYWMIALTIPFECQDWHLNRLLTLIKVCNKKNSPPKKMGKADLAARNRELNDARKNQNGTTG